MKRIAALLLLLVAACAGFAQTQSASAEPKLSPAERSIAQARKLLEKKPNDFEAYNALALALSRRARETSDVAFYAHLFAARSAAALGRLDDAQDHVDAALALFPKAQSALLAASHVALLRAEPQVAFSLFARLGDLAPADHTALADPWILYSYGAGRLVEPLLADLWLRASSLRR